jgi:hypothetical protein
VLAEEINLKRKVVFSSQAAFGRRGIFLCGKSLQLWVEEIFLCNYGTECGKIRKSR